MKKIKLALGIHNHQPVGNFDFVFEDAYQRAYSPFLQILEKHPKIKLAQHYTGVLFEWLLNRDADFGKMLRQMVARGQIEMMSGGFYEPILVNIPDEDKLGQIDKLNRFVKEHTGYDAKGLWLAERIWEPQLPKILAQTGARYVVIDDSHFKTAGLEEKDLYGYYLTEETGSVINIFPISERLRYTIPFADPQETIDFLASIATEEGDKLVVFADDGEKFGIWPNTYKHCYEDGWLEKFFMALEENSEWIELVHFSEALETLLPLGRVYLPTASYREMMEWALPSQAILRYGEFEQQLKEAGIFDKYKMFVRGGFWRNFLAKYPESNNLHKKSLRVSRKIQAAKQMKKIDSQLLEKAQDHLWAGQTNCPYWHGIFGGLYLNNLRYAVYKNMIQAEGILDRLTHSDADFRKGWVSVENCDIDADGRDEILVESKIYNLYFSPHSGGTLFEMDFKPKAVNLLDTMTRRYEAYHQRLLDLAKQKKNGNGSATKSIHEIVTVKEPGLEKRLKYDWYRRTSFIDHFLGEDSQLTDVANCEYDEVGDFVAGEYAAKVQQKSGSVRVSLARSGQVRKNGQFFPVRIAKHIDIPAGESELRILYELTNQTTEWLELWFAVEMNFALLAGNAPDRYYYFDQKIDGDTHLASQGIVPRVRKMGLKDEWMKIDAQIKFDSATDVWRFPIETISQSEGGFERVYQSSVVLPNWKIKLAENKKWQIAMTIKIVTL
ncbi:MAG: DUF1926 domain-containing protein [Calditrichaeota bacterium]|nr:DUF1926 domain-containing protein [Calditrichota bacterium]